MIFIGAAVALLLGVISAVATYSSMNVTEDVGDVVSMGLQSSTMIVSQVSSTLLGCLLPAGVLLGAGMAIRLQVARLEAEFLAD